MKLDNRVAIVTGGARGIGLAIAEDLWSHGASVVIVDAGVSIAGQPEDALLAEKVAHGKDRWAAVCGDIAQTSVARTAVETAQTRFGGVDVVINNAAIIRDAFIFKSDDAAWDAVIVPTLPVPNGCSRQRRRRCGNRRKPAARPARSSTSSRPPASTETSARRPTPAPRPVCSA